MLIVKKILNFSAIAVAVALTLLFPGSTSQAATGRLGNYSLLSAHGGGDSGPVDDLNGAYKASTGAYAAGNCTHCHEQHTGSVPLAVVPGPLLFEDLANNAFCNYCHGPAPLNNADSISPQISKTYAHKPTGSAIRDVLCNECHDSHEATTGNHINAIPSLEGTNTASGALSGLTGTDVLWVAPGLPGPGNELINNASYGAVGPITEEYVLCLNCHGDQYTGLGLTDISGQFNPDNFSVHPIATTVPYKNFVLNLNFNSALLGPWATANNMKMYCSDCHGSDNPADPVGPHGSNNAYMLKDTGPVPGVLDTLCDNCHVLNLNGAAVGGFSGFDDQPGWNPNPSIIPGISLGLGDHSLLEHRYPANPLGCTACHGGLGDVPLGSNIHGANYQWPDIGGTGVSSFSFLVGGPFNTDIYTPGTGSYCASMCHGGGAAYRYK